MSGLRELFEAAAAGTTRDDFDELLLAGAPRAYLWRGPCKFGVAEIAPGDTHFEFADGGRRAFIVPTEPLPPLTDEACLTWSPCDLVAWFSADPARWRCFTGAASFLHSEAIDRAQHYHEPLRLYSSPLSWLRAGGDGAVILDAEANLRLWFLGLPAIVADTMALGEEIECRMREPPVKKPQVLVPNGRAAA